MLTILIISKIKNFVQLFFIKLLLFNGTKVLGKRMDIALDKITGMTYWLDFIVEILHCSQVLVNYRKNLWEFCVIETEGMAISTAIKLQPTPAGLTGISN